VFCLELAKAQTRLVSVTIITLQEPFLSWTRGGEGCSLDTISEVWAEGVVAGQVVATATTPISGQLRPFWLLVDFCGLSAELRLEEVQCGRISTRGHKSMEKVQYPAQNDVMFSLETRVSALEPLGSSSPPWCSADGTKDFYFSLQPCHLTCGRIIAPDQAGRQQPSLLLSRG